MSKMRITLATVLATVAVPMTAFAIHASNCCGDWVCCLRHLGCCP
jgi:hypothetical protein